jgi:hypothetical protein
MIRPSAALFLLCLLGPRPLGGYQPQAHPTTGPRAAADTARPGPEPVGIAAGVSVWPPDLYCAGPMTATMQPLEPRVVLDRIQLAARCGLRLVIVPPRKFLTSTGKGEGVFLLDRAMELTDRYAARLPPDTLRKYRATLLGMNLADDYNCAKCWGGQTISRSDIASWAAYARTKLPGLPLGVRIEPKWVADNPKLASLLDYAWAQYQTRRGDQQAYYDKAASEAKRLGLRLVMGVSVQKCYGPDSGACTVADLLRFGTTAVTHPASCAFINWRYDAATWDDPAVQAAWAKLLALAKSRPTQDCRRQGG